MAEVKASEVKATAPIVQGLIANLKNFLPKSNTGKSDTTVLRRADTPTPLQSAAKPPVKSS